ncbi:hypothetical protein [Taibaiella helva]|uniref:hypothetical protein n=1 Tax=Taibaiella helva TaxID=2301235 RepID=UPI000E56F01B|nr:hypothetical protein [Taibaiella helva]
MIEETNTTQLNLTRSMRTKQEFAEQKIRLPDHALAHLLGLSLSEYKHLSHKPLKASKDSRGNIIEFYMQISNNNNPEVMAKIGLDLNNIVWFERDEVESCYTK